MFSIYSIYVHPSLTCTCLMTATPIILSSNHRIPTQRHVPLWATTEIATTIFLLFERIPVSHILIVFFLARL